MKDIVNWSDRPRPTSWTLPPWEQTPWSNWRRWLGWSLRRHHGWSYSPEEDYWEYGRPRRVARELLAEKFECKPQMGDWDGNFEYIFDGEEWIDPTVYLARRT